MDNDLLKFNHLLISLGVISSLQENDLLSWDSSCSPNIQFYGPFRPLRRYWTRQSRADNIQNLNRIIYDAINLYKENDMNSFRIKQALLESTHGLKNLMKTYSTDHQIVQAIYVLHQDIINLDETN